MYHPFYSRSVLRIISLSDYHHAKSQITILLLIIQLHLFLIGYEKIIALGFKKFAKKNQFIFSKRCNLLVTMINLNSSKGSKMISRRPSMGASIT